MNIDEMNPEQVAATLYATIAEATTDELVRMLFQVRVSNPAPELKRTLYIQMATQLLVKLSREE